MFRDEKTGEYTDDKVLLTEAELLAWGWRIPFVIGALLSVVALYLRHNLDETAAFGRGHGHDAAVRPRGRLRRPVRGSRNAPTAMGRVTRHVVIASDVTIRKDQERRLAEADPALVVGALQRFIRGLHIEG